VNEVLEALRSNLKSAVGSDFRFIEVFQEWEANTILRTDQLPALMIAPQSESRIDSNWANHEERRYTVLIRVIMASAKHNEVRLGNKNIYDLTDKLLRKLAEDKTLGGVVRGWEPQGDFQDKPVFMAGRQNAVARDVNLVFHRFAEWQSRENDERKNAQSLFI
jgi:hypothetical protein